MSQTVKHVNIRISVYFSGVEQNMGNPGDLLLPVCKLFNKSNKSYSGVAGVMRLSPVCSVLESRLVLSGVESHPCCSPFV